MKKQAATHTAAPAQNHADALMTTMNQLFRVSRGLHLLGATLAPKDSCNAGPALSDEDIFTLGEQLKHAADEIGTLILDTLSDAADALRDHEPEQTIQ